MVTLCRGPGMPVIPLPSPDGAAVTRRTTGVVAAPGAEASTILTRSPFVGIRVSNFDVAGTRPRAQAPRTPSRPMMPHPRQMYGVGRPKRMNKNTSNHVTWLPFCTGHGGSARSRFLIPPFYGRLLTVITVQNQAPRSGHIPIIRLGVLTPFIWWGRSQLGTGGSPRAKIAATATTSTCRPLGQP